jgi:pyridoxamine 5'-phosphate oxidase
MSVLRRRELDPDPIAQFAAWYVEAREAGVRMPEAVALATATRSGAPSARMVLLKGFEVAGFVFFTGYDSRKGRELEGNPRAALLFYWDPLGRQVRIEGRVERVDAAESDAYWATRPLGSRLSAAASEQSRPVENRELLEQRVASLAAAAEGPGPARPERWGGYRLEPDAFEFWQHRDDRLHDRFRYSREGGGWTVERLQP